MERSSREAYEINLATGRFLCRRIVGNESLDMISGLWFERLSTRRARGDRTVIALSGNEGMWMTHDCGKQLIRWELLWVMAKRDTRQHFRLFFLRCFMVRSSWKDWQGLGTSFWVINFCSLSLQNFLLIAVVFRPLEASRKWPSKPFFPRK